MLLQNSNYYLLPDNFFMYKMTYTCIPSNLKHISNIVMDVAFLLNTLTENIILLLKST